MAHSLDVIALPQPLSNDAVTEPAFISSRDGMTE